MRRPGWGSTPSLRQKEPTMQKYRIANMKVRPLRVLAYKSVSLFKKMKGDDMIDREGVTRLTYICANTWDGYEGLYPENHTWNMVETD